MDSPTLQALKELVAEHDEYWRTELELRGPGYGQPVDTGGMALARQALALREESGRSLSLDLSGDEAQLLLGVLQSTLANLAPGFESARDTLRDLLRRVGDLT